MKNVSRKENFSCAKLIKADLYDMFVTVTNSIATSHHIIYRYSSVIDIDLLMLEKFFV